MGWGFKKNYRFSGQFMTFPGLFNFGTPKIPPRGPLWWGGSHLFRFESFPDQSANACQIWSRCDGRVEKGGYRQTDIRTDRQTDIQKDRQTYTHTKGHCSFIIIVDGHHIVMYAPCWVWNNVYAVAPCWVWNNVYAVGYAYQHRSSSSLTSITTLLASHPTTLANKTTDS